MSDPVKVGFVGAGNLASRVHYPSLAEIEATDLRAISELDEGRLTDTADQYDVPGRYTNYRDMLEREDLDAVYVVMPPHLLHDIVVDCLQAGKHVFVEKPPGVSTYETEAFAWYAERHNCLSMTGFNRRFIPLLRHCKAVVEAAGPIHMVSVRFHKYDPAIDDFGFYRGSVSHLTSDIIHAVDSLRWLAGGEVVEVNAHTRALGRAYINVHAALIEFSSGCSGVLLASRRAGARRHTFEFHGGDVSAYCEDGVEGMIYRDDSNTPEFVRGSDLIDDPDALHQRSGFQAESRHFMESIQAGVQPLTNFAEAAKTMRLVDQIAADRR
jgi:virulence factor